MKKADCIAPFLTSFFRDYLIRERNLSPHTVCSYRDALKLFLIFLRVHTKKPCSKIVFQDIHRDLVRQFLSHLEEERGNCVRSRNHRLTVLRCFFEYVVGLAPQHADICRAVTSFPTKKGIQTSIDYLEKEELEALFLQIDRSQPAGVRDYALLLFLYNTGARVQESVDLRVEWLTLSKPYRVSILGKGKKWRVCPLWDATGNALRELLDLRAIYSGDEHVFLNRFGKVFSRRGIYGVLRKYAGLASADLPRLSKKKISPHLVRHTTAMHMLQSGVDLNSIRTWLGHVSIDTTHQYAQIDLKMKAIAMERCKPSFLDSGQSRLPTWKTNPDILAWLEAL